MKNTQQTAHGVCLLLLGLVIVGGLVPLAFYWALFGRVATITVDEAKQRLKRKGEETVLVDVRRPEAFLAGHLGGAVNWPIETVLALRHADGLPPAFRGKTLLLICDVGWDSRRAADHLAAIGVGRAINVRGGIQEWIHATPSPTWSDFDRWQIGPDRLVGFPFRESPLGEQVAAVAAFFFFKPIYTILSLLIVIALWNSREADLAAVRWAMIAFFVGENASRSITSLSRRLPTCSSICTASAWPSVSGFWRMPCWKVSIAAF